MPHLERWLEQGELDRDAWRQGRARQACSAPRCRNEYGGAGGDYRHDTVIMEEFLQAQGLAGWGNQVHSSIVAPYILHYGDEEQRQSAGCPKHGHAASLVGAIAMTEPNTGSDLQSVQAPRPSAMATST